MKALVGAFNQEKALVGAFSVIVKTGCGTDGALHSTNVDVISFYEASVLWQHIVHCGRGVSALPIYFS